MAGVQGKVAFGLSRALHGTGPGDPQPDVRCVIGMRAGLNAIRQDGMGVPFVCPPRDVTGRANLRWE